MSLYVGGAWDCDVVPEGTGEIDRTVAVRVASHGLASPPLSLALMLDVGSAMEGPRRAAALRAWSTAWDVLAEADRVALHTFDWRGRARPSWVTKDALRTAAPPLALVSGLEAAIEALGAAFGSLEGAAALARSAVVLTDDDPFDGVGAGEAARAVYAPALARAAELRRTGVEVSCIELRTGVAGFRTGLLADLAARGGGQFTSIAGLDELGAAVAAHVARRPVLLGASLGAVAGRGLTVRGAARVVPDYVELEVEGGRVALGQVPSEAWYLLDVRVSRLDARRGATIGPVELELSGEDAAGTVQRASSSTSLRVDEHHRCTIDASVNELRRVREEARASLARERAPDVAGKVKHTRTMLTAAQEAGDEDASRQYEVDVELLSSNKTPVVLAQAIRITYAAPRWALTAELGLIQARMKMR